MRVLIACEFSGTVRRAFANRGHFVVSCDLLPCEDGAPWGAPESLIGQHYQGNVLDFLAMGETGEMPGRWDLMIAHPPCTYLCSSGLHWNRRITGREEKTTEALAFVRALLYAPIQRICIENPIGRIGTAIRKADQIIQPYQFGHDASKATALWLKGLPLLHPTRYVAPRIVDGRKRWANQTDSGQNKIGPSERRWAERSITYQGIASAMADQWGAMQ